MREKRVCRDCKQEVTNWHIHHKNRDHGDNSPENLETLCPKCHGYIHGYDSQEAGHGVRFGDTYDAMTNKSRFGIRLQDGYEMLRD